MRKSRRNVVSMLVSAHDQDPDGTPQIPRHVQQTPQSYTRSERQEQLGDRTYDEKYPGKVLLPLEKQDGQESGVCGKAG